MTEGGCLCGAVRYRLTGLSQRVTHCHCSMCRKQHGAGFATYARHARADVDIRDASGALAAYRSSDKVLRQFCRNCGSSLFWSHDDTPERLGVALGTLDAEPDRQPEAHILVESKAAWLRIADDLPQYALTGAKGSVAIRIARVADLPADFEEIVALSLAEDFPAMQRMREDWETGANRFAKVGELMFEARIGPRIAGICGLNRDPYLGESTVGRLRHLYVVPVFRLRGVGRLLVSTVVERAFPGFSRVRLRTLSADADRFYLAIGFRHTRDEADATHETLPPG